MIDKKDKAVGMLVGLAIGDALGTTNEFKKRDSYDELTDMIGGGVFNLPAGAYTDDTSMAICLGQSLLESKGFDPINQLEKYLAWRDFGLNSSTGRCFDIGNSTTKSISLFSNNSTLQYPGKLNPDSAGNGSLMRLAPIVLYFKDNKDILTYAALSSYVTHGSKYAADSCKFFAYLLYNALSGKQKNEIFNLNLTGMSEEVNRIANGSYKYKNRDQISSSGFALNSLEAALWCVYNTNNFNDSVLLAANLGDDSDTVAAITGQLSGAIYGHDQINKEWKDKLFDYEKIRQLALDLFNS